MTKRHSESTGFPRPHWPRAMLPFLFMASVVPASGCSATSVYKKVATIGLEMVGDAVEGDKQQNESSQIIGHSPADADRRYGTPTGVYRDMATGREVRVYPVKDDLLGKKRWVLEVERDRVDALSLAEENPDVGKDKAKALLLEGKLRGKTPEEVRATPVLDKLMFDSQPRRLKRVPTGELIEVYNVTSFLDITGSRYIVIGFDSADRCESVRYVGMP